MTACRSSRFRNPAARAGRGDAAGHADLVALQRRLHLEPAGLDRRDDLFCFHTFNPLFDRQFLPRRQRRDRRVAVVHVAQVDVALGQLADHDFVQRLEPRAVELLIQPVRETGSGPSFPASTVADRSPSRPVTKAERAILSLAGSSMAAWLPLKSKRVTSSLRAWLRALSISCRSISETMSRTRRFPRRSKEGIPMNTAPAAGRKSHGVASRFTAALTRVSRRGFRL